MANQKSTETTVDKSLIAKPLYAKPLIESRIPELQKKVEEISLKLKRQPCLCVVLVGDDPASQVYVGHKEKMCQRIGAKSLIIKLPESITEANFLNEINDLNTNPSIDGMIIQLPLPKQLQNLPVATLVPADRDVDGFHPLNTADLYNNARPGQRLEPCTPSGIIDLLEYHDVEWAGKNIVVIGRSQIVGLPMSLLALNRNATVTICHSRTKNIEEQCKKADIIVVAVGRPEFLDDRFINEDRNQIIVDVGIHRVNGQLVGDVESQRIEDKVAAYTPVPGGVGPMTVFKLMDNLMTACQRKLKI